MADPLSSTSLTTQPNVTKPTVQPIPEAFGQSIEPTVPGTGYKITINRFAANGTAAPLIVHIPENASPQAIRQNPLLLAAVLKDGDPVWKNYEPGFILVAALKAAGLGLDLLEGDIYPVEGRLGISDWAKIKYARAHGYRAVVQVETGARVTWNWNTQREKGIWEGTNDKITVTVLDKNERSVSTYDTTLKAWWVGHSREWRDRTAESLRRKAIARAYQEVCPVGVDPEEAPPLVTSLFPLGDSQYAEVNQKAEQGLRAMSDMQQTASPLLPTPLGASKGR